MYTIIFIKRKTCSTMKLNQSSRYQIAKQKSLLIKRFWVFLFYDCLLCKFFCFCFFHFKMNLCFQEAEVVLDSYCSCDTLAQTQQHKVPQIWISEVQTKFYHAKIEMSVSLIPFWKLWEKTVSLSFAVSRDSPHSLTCGLILSSKPTIVQAYLQSLPSDKSFSYGITQTQTLLLTPSSTFKDSMIILG